MQFEIRKNNVVLFSFKLSIDPLIRIIYYKLIMLIS